MPQKKDVLNPDDNRKHTFLSLFSSTYTGKLKARFQWALLDESSWQSSNICLLHRLLEIESTHLIQIQFILTPALYFDLVFPLANSKHGISMAF